MTDLTPSQLKTLRETGSVRVVVKMEPQPTGFIDYGNKRTSPTVGLLNPYPIPNPLPSPGTIETIDGMECEWVERGCKQRANLTADEIGKMGDQGRWCMDLNEWIWTAIVRRKDDSDELRTDERTESGHARQG